MTGLNSSYFLFLVFVQNIFTFATICGSVNLSVVSMSEILFENSLFFSIIFNSIFASPGPKIKICFASLSKSIK